jgi:hypothetical protein
MDAVQQVTILESSYSAANGKVAGANFNFVTKSGTQKFHGGLYYYFRNEVLNANSYFNKFNDNWNFNLLQGICGPVRSQYR